MFKRKNKIEMLSASAVRLMSTSIMLLDDDFRIVHVNEALSEELSKQKIADRHHGVVQTDSLIGKKLDELDTKAGILEIFCREHRSIRSAVIQIGPTCFDVTVVPLRSANGEVAGYSVEWRDARKRLENRQLQSELKAVHRSQAVVTFKLDGTVITANDNFLSLMGYVLSEIQGNPHSMFVPAEDHSGQAYRDFWSSLNRGEYVSGEFKRITKQGNEVWIQASYNPVLDERGVPVSVVKFASDVTQEKRAGLELQARIDAIGKSQAVIEFAMDGTVLSANENFLKALGYSLAEIEGRHHSVFVDQSESKSAAYREFWASLCRGEYQAAEYKRIGKSGREVWIQASYNPILDLNGRPFKVVKYATDTTLQVLARLKSDRVCSMMESVAAGSEELSASVREISEAMVKSRMTAVSAVEKVEDANSKAQQLALASQSMSGIVDLIHNITGQINLLALNATIESARAGEAGRGFAVVASEVKSLANQAKQATDRISGEINGLKDISTVVVDALISIKQEIQGVSEYVSATAAAIEEQSAVTNEMSNSMQRAAAEAVSNAA